MGIWFCCGGSSGCRAADMTPPPPPLCHAVPGCASDTNQRKFVPPCRGQREAGGMTGETRTRRERARAPGRSRPRARARARNQYPAPAIVLDCVTSTRYCNSHHAGRGRNHGRDASRAKHTGITKCNSRSTRPREYLTEREIEKLIEAAEATVGPSGRHRHPARLSPWASRQ